MAVRPIISRNVIDTFRNNREMHRFLMDLYGQTTDVNTLLSLAITYTEVSDITNPVELNSVEGNTESSLLIAYASGSYTAYSFSTTSLVANSPYIVDGLTGSWVAIGGKYLNSDFNLSELNVGYVDYDTTISEPAHQTGRVNWNDDAGTIEVSLKGGTVRLQVGQEVLTPRAKAIGSDILNGQAVYVSGGVGSSPIPEMSLAKADAIATSGATIAIATEDVTQNALGYFVTMGVARELDTTMWPAGTELFLSASTAGELDSTEPTSPNFSVSIGIVLRSHATGGAIFVGIRLLMAKFSRIYGMTGTYIPFADANGFLTESINLVFKNNNLGVGQSNPTARVHLASGTATAGTAPIKISSGGVPLTTPEVGSLEFYSGRFWITNVATQRAIDRSSSALVSTITVQNTTTETTVLTETIGANGLMVGNFAKLIASGDVTNAAAIDNVTLRVKIDGTTIASITSPGIVLSNDCFHLSSHATIRAIGASGSVVYHIDLDIEGTSNDSCGSQTIDTTGTTTISVTAQWNNAKAGNIFNLTQAILELKN